MSELLKLSLRLSHACCLAGWAPGPTGPTGRWLHVFLLGCARHELPSQIWLHEEPEVLQLFFGRLWITPSLGPVGLWWPCQELLPPTTWLPGSPGRPNPSITIRWRFAYVISGAHTLWMQQINLVKNWIVVYYYYTEEAVSHIRLDHFFQAFSMHLFS